MSLSEATNVILAFLGILFLALIILSVIQSLFERVLNRRKVKHEPVRGSSLENTPLNLKDFGFAVKRWDDATYTVNAYIDVSSPDISFKSTYPTITWTNEQGQELDSNNGRWAISNEDMARMKTDERLTIDLDANGKPQKLYLTTNNKERKLYSWWRSPDGFNKSKLITDSPAYIMIFLKASNGCTARFSFRISHSSDVLRLERLNNKRQVIDVDNAREFRYAELFPDEKKENNNAKKTKGDYPSAIVKRFSSNLEKIKKERIKAGWKTTGIGLGFLDKIKTTPPFLGLRHENPVITELHERELTEYFNAGIYMEKHQDSIRGGESYIVKDGDDRRKIAKEVYGKENYGYYIGRETKEIKTGMVLTLPYINLDTTHDHDYIEKQIRLYRDKDRVASMLQKSYNLVEDEGVALLRLIYDAAQQTLYERKKKQKSSLRKTS